MLLPIALMPVLFGLAATPIAQRQSSGVEGSLVVTATIVSSVAIVIDPDGAPLRVIANSTDSPETFVRLVPEHQNVMRIRRKRTSVRRQKGVPE